MEKKKYINIYNSRLDKDQIVGLTDSEGMFYIAVQIRNGRSTTRYTYLLEFRPRSPGFGQDCGASKFTRGGAGLRPRPG